MELNEKLSHLSEVEVEEIIRMYCDKSIKIQDIINKYKVDVNVSGFKKILPPVKTDSVCKICHQNLYKKIEGRDHFTKENYMFCLNCGHNEYIRKRYWEKRVCECRGCVEIRNKIFEEKREQIREEYTTDTDIESICFEDMELSDKIKLIYILSHNKYKNYYEISPVPDSEININYLRRLYEIRAILVSPESDVSAFPEENFPKSFYINKVSYDVNVDFKEETIEMLKNRKYFVESVDIDILLRILKIIIYNDLIEQFKDKLEKRRLELHISESAKEDLIELIDEISYTQILWYCERVAVYFSDKVITGDMNRKAAKNAVLGNVSKFYRRAQENSWEIKHEEIDTIGELLRFYIYNILNTNIDILYNVISEENYYKYESEEYKY